MRSLTRKKQAQRMWRLRRVIDTLRFLKKEAGRAVANDDSDSVCYIIDATVSKFVLIRPETR